MTQRTPAISKPSAALATGSPHAGLPSPAWWARVSLSRKLLLSYLLVILIGSATLLAVIELTSPGFVAEHMMRMQQSQGAGMGIMHGQDSAFVAQRDASLQAAFRAGMQQALILAMLAAVLAALAASFVVSSRITSPLRRMVRATGRVASGEYAERVTVPAGHAEDELGHLATSFNNMAASLQETETRRQALIGDVAHELRTPLATLEGYLEGLLDGVIKPSPELWARLHGEAGRLRRLVADLQELSRAEARQIPLRIEPVESSGIVGAVRNRLAPDFAAKGIDLHVDLPERLPAVRADRDRAIQILTNLLTNALRYTPSPGSVTVSADVRDGVVRFMVRDTGIGIAPEYLAHVFERFYRIDKSRSRMMGGTGIGLTISRALAEAMGGELWASSDGLGRGSTFGLALPIDSRSP